MTARIIAIGALTIVYLALTVVVAFGSLDGLDLQAAGSFAELWRPSLQIPAQAVAELGGLELTTLVVSGLAIYLVRAGFGADAWALLAFPIAVTIETAYKLLLTHPGPPLSMSHGDGPSITDLFSTTSQIGNSFPSGHMARATVTYGLLAFVVARLTASRRAAMAAWTAAVFVIALLAADRMYLEVHWLSDVIGGLLLGCIALVCATVWLDRPLRKPDV